MEKSAPSSKGDKSVVNYTSTWRKGWWQRAWRGLLVALHPRHAMPCVGLVVVGGCLTLIMTPDDPVPASEPVPREALPTIVLDAGHGGKDEGTKWRGVSEKDLTLDVAQRVEKLLKPLGFPTMLTRRDNSYIALSQRVQMANATPNSLFVSIHFNSDPSGTSSGVETFYARQKTLPAPSFSWVGLFTPPEAATPDTSEVLAGTVQSALAQRTAARNRGIRPSNFYVVQHTQSPAILIEAGFISNAFEAGLIRTEVYRQSLAEAIVDGIVQYQKLRTQPGGLPPRLAMKN